jgi:predicted nucleotidyltransferase
MKNLDELNLNEREKRGIAEASRMLKERFPVEEVILFGSKARGDHDEESDIDLLLLTSRPVHWKEREAIIDALFDVELTYDVVISILINTIHDWNDGICTAFPIHKEITREGVLVS